MLRLADYSWAFAKDALLILLHLLKISFALLTSRVAYHLCKTSCCDYVSSMNEAIQVPSTSLDLVPHVVVDFHVKDICDEVECILVVLDFRVESSQIEPISKVVLIHIAEVLVSSSSNELVSLLALCSANDALDGMMIDGAASIVM